MPNKSRPKVPARDDAIATRVRLRLAVRRRALGLAPELLDVVCGLRRGPIGRLEQGKSRMTALHLFRLAAVLDVEIDWFFATDDLLPPQPGEPAVPQPGPRYDEMRQFLEVFAHLGSRRIRAEIRGLIDAVADHPCDNQRGCLPVAQELSPMP